MFDTDAINRKIWQEALSEEHHYASSMYRRLVNAITEFEEGLDNDKQAGARLVSFGESIAFAIDDMGYMNPNIIIFYGTLPSGEPVELYQHISQLSVLLVVFPRTDPTSPRRRIGFDLEPESDE